jgi:hypothetical protein
MNNKSECFMRGLRRLVFGIAVFFVGLLAAGVIGYLSDTHGWILWSQGDPYTGPLNGLVAVWWVLLGAASIGFCGLIGAISFVILYWLYSFTLNLGGYKRDESQQTVEPAGR